MQTVQERRVVQIMVPTYIISFPQWHWCKIGDVCRAIPDIIRLHGYEYNPTIEDLIADFAALARPNKPRFEGEQTKKFFRYSPDGIGLRAKEVPNDPKDYRKNPPWRRFELDEQITSETFVPEGWARDVLRAALKGVILGRDDGDHLCGQTGRDKEGHIHLVRLDRAPTEGV